MKYEFGQKSVKFLTETLGMPIAGEGEFKGLSFNTYPGVGHSTNQKELDDLRAWLKKAVSITD